MRKIGENCLVFGIGGMGYVLIELLWRGYTHWTMLLLGGISFSAIYFIENTFRYSLLIKSAAASLFITAAELVTGFIVNILLGWDVWDYSDVFLNIAGQICPLFSFFWFLLCVPAFKLCALLSARSKRCN